MASAINKEEDAVKSPGDRTVTAQDSTESPYEGMKDNTEDKHDTKDKDITPEVTGAGI